MALDGVKLSFLLYTKRDFIDLYVICQDFTPLSQLLQLFPRKYSSAGYSRYHLARSLSYFEDAERDPPPLLLRELDWAQVKAFFLSQRPLVEAWAGLA